MCAAIDRHPIMLMLLVRPYVQQNNLPHIAGYEESMAGRFCVQVWKVTPNLLLRSALSTLTKHAIYNTWNVQVRIKGLQTWWQTKDRAYDASQTVTRYACNKQPAQKHLLVYKRAISHRLTALPLKTDILRPTAIYMCSLFYFKGKLAAPLTDVRMYLHTNVNLLVL